MQDLINTEVIAEMLQCSRKHVTDRVIKRPDFPAPTVAVSRKMRLWDRARVLEWAGQPSRSAISAGVAL